VARPRAHAAHQCRCGRSTARAAACSASP
jgi:hypothetical protein